MSRWRTVCGLLAVISSAAISGCAPPSKPLSFSPDGDRLAFPGGEPSRLHVATADGAELRALPGTEDAASPRWSPDGSLLAFGQKDALAFYDLGAGSVAHRLEGAQPLAIWSPAGDEVVGFRDTPEGLTAEWLQLPGFKPVRSARLPVERVNAHVDGVWLAKRDGIAFMSYSTSGEANLYTVEGDDVYRITNTGDVTAFGLLPDGEHLIWARSTPNAAGVGISFWSYDLRSRSGRKLPFRARFGTSAQRAARSAGVGGVTFSPDGRRLALTVFQGEDAHEVYTSRLDGTDLRLVERIQFPKRRAKAAPAIVDYFAGAYWSPDGNRLAVLKTGKHEAIRVYDTAGGPGRKLLLPTAPLRTEER